jgi:two-component system, cell cycle response regulator
MKKIVLFIGFGDIQLELARRFVAYRGLDERIEIRGEQRSGGAADGYVVNGDDAAAFGRLALHVRSNPKPVLSVGAQAAPGSVMYAPGPFKPATANRLGEMMTGKPVVAPATPNTAPAASAVSASKVVAFPRPVTPESNAQVLVVDDSEMVRRTMLRKITEYGHTSDLAENGEEAMAMLLSNQYRVIFLDVMMPGLNGLEICKRIKRSPEYKGTAVYMLTSKDGMFDRVRANMAGCDGYLVKPLESRKLRDVLEKYFDHPNMVGESTIQPNQPLNAAELAAIAGTPPPQTAMTAQAPLLPMEPLGFQFTNGFAPTFAPTVPAALLDKKTSSQ